MSWIFGTFEKALEGLRIDPPIQGISHAAVDLVERT